MILRSVLFGTLYRHSLFLVPTDTFTTFFEINYVWTASVVRFDGSLLRAKEERAEMGAMRHSFNALQE